MQTPVIVAIIVAIAGPLFGYIAAARKLSGKIDTSEASQLWEESKAIREDYRERLTLTETRQAALEGRIALLEQANSQLREENIKLVQANIEKAHEIALLTDQNERLARENAKLRERLGL